MNPSYLQGEAERILTRRTFLTRSSTGLGAMALASLLPAHLRGASGNPTTQAVPGALKALHLPPKAKRVIYLFQSGAPSHLDLFDPKPKLKEMTGQELPPSVRRGQRITGMTAGQSVLKCVGSPFEFKKYGKSGMEITSLMPNIGAVADDISLIRTMHVDAINHDPAVTFFGTGNQQPGRPTMGSWIAYGLGSENANLPSYVVLVSGSGGQSLQARYWGNGFLSANYQGVQLRSQGDPVLYVSNPPGMSGDSRRQLLDAMQTLNRKRLGILGDPDIASHIDSYELAFRMQTSVPELTDLSKEPESVLALYGPSVREPGTFAYNCLMARRLIERGVRCVQVMHAGWDQHNSLTTELYTQCRDTDQPSAGLVIDLKQRGLLDETVVVWGGEFGRTPFIQGNLDDRKRWGRDHHPYAFTSWMAGGGVRPGMSYGETDDLGMNAVHKPVHVHDFQATLLHQMGIHHERLTYRFQGRDFRLTDVHGKVVREILQDS